MKKWDQAQPPTPLFYFFLDKVVELLGGGSAINGAYPV